MVDWIIALAGGMVCSITWQGIMEQRDRPTTGQICRTFSRETFAEWTNITEHGVIDRANEDMNHHI